MQLKWDQGLASRGKLKGKKTFEHAASLDVKVDGPNKVASQRMDVRWADCSAATSSESRKRRKREIEEDVADSAVEVDHVLPPKKARRRDSQDIMALATISPAIPVLPMNPAAPVPDILFKDDNARLFSHYLNHVSKVTVVTDTNQNPFKTIICPMSFQSPLIMSNILAIAAANISHRHPEYGVVAYQHLSNAYAELKARLAKPETALTEITLAGVLGQVSCQLHIGDVANWRVHLTAARGIVNALGGPNAVLNNRPSYKFYIQHLAWLDTLAATTSSTKSIGKSEYWEALLLSIQERKADYSMKDLMGCPEELLQIIAEMTRKFDNECLPSDLDLEGDFTTKIVELVDTPDTDAAKQEQMSRNLLGAEYAAKLEALAPAEPPADAAAALSEIFRIAAKIYLTYRIVHSTCWSAKLQDYLREGLELLALIPAKSQQEMALPWPLFIMGSICVYRKEQKIIQARYAGMTRYMGFGNIQRCIELLNEVWQGWRDAENRSCPSRLAGQPWDEKELGRKRWEDVMVEKGYDLLLA